MDGTIVVGVDGSAVGDAALRWAVEEALLRSASVRVVHAFDVQAALAATPVAMGTPAMPIPPQPGDQDELLRATQHEARAVLDRALSRVETASGVAIEPILVGGPAGDMLVEQSQHAELLVVGSHRHGELHDLVLGSVTRHCVKHAACPVVVIPPVPEPE